MMLPALAHTLRRSSAPPALIGTARLRILAARQWLCILLFGGLLLALPAHAVVPESGYYGDASRPGVGYYLEVQGSTVVFVTYAHDKVSGLPTSYLASGLMTESKAPLTPEFSPPRPLEHAYPYQFFGTMHEIQTGPCLACGVPESPGSREVRAVGQVLLWFVDRNRLAIEIHMADGSNIVTTAKRLGAGRDAMALGTPSGAAARPRSVTTFQGEWVFVDLEEPRKTPLRLHFGEANTPVAGEYTSPASDAWGNPLVQFAEHYVQFTDPASNATMTCGMPGCELVVNGASVLLVRYHDLGMDRILGYANASEALTLQAALDLRSAHRISGIRIADPTPQPTANAGQEGDKP